MNQDQIAIERNTLPQLVTISEGEVYVLLEQFRDIQKSREDDIVDNYFAIYTDIFNLPVKDEFGMYYMMIQLEAIRARNTSKEIYKGLVEEAQHNLAGFLSEQEVYQSGVTSDKVKTYLEKTVFSEGAVDEFTKQYQEKVRMFRESKTKSKRPREEMDQLDTIRYTDPITRKLFITYSYESDDLSDVLEYFNRAKVSPNVPFLTIQSFYKVYRDAPISSKWTESYPDQVLGYTNVDAGKYAMFLLTSENTIVIESTEQKEWDKIEDEAVNQSNQMVLSNIRTTFTMPNLEMKSIKEDIRVECFFPDIDLHPILFKHFLYTHPTMRWFFFLDERLMVSRKKTYLYIFYYPTLEDTSPITLIVNNVFVSTKDKKLASQLTPNRCHVKVYMSRCSRAQIKPALLDIGRCFAEFQKHRSELEKELVPEPNVLHSTRNIVTLAKLNESYLERCRPHEEKVEAVSDEALPYRSIFKNNRSIQFTPKVYKEIDASSYYLINPEDSEQPEKWEDQDESKKQALIFPKKKDAEELDLTQYYYTCTDSRYQKTPFIGLAKSERHDPPYLPNCYPSSQVGKNSGLREYLNEQESQLSSTSYIIKTGKHVNVNKFGSMLPEIDRWMNLTHPDLMLYRYGYSIPSTASSILCLLEHFKYRIEFSDIDVNAARTNLIKYVRKRSIGRSEAFPYTSEQLVTQLTNPAQWIDPRMYYHALRELYEIELIFFTKNEKKSKSPFYLTCPYFHYEYDETKTKKYDHALLICINNGGEFEKPEYPICEPIFLFPISNGQLKPSDEPKRDAYVISTSSSLYRTCERTINEWYGKTVRYHPFSMAPTAQTLNSFGKIAWLHFGEVSLSLSVPIHSIEVPVVPERSFGCTKAQAEQFIEEEKTEHKERKTGSALLGYDLKKDGRLFFLPIRSSHTPYLEEYKKYEKVSRIMIEYVCYLFSKYLHANKVTTRVDKETLNAYLEDFSNSMFVIDPMKEYPILPRAFTLDNNPYVSEGKWRVNNDTVRAKLMYSLRQRYKTNPERLLMYYTIRDMLNYYIYLSDFAEDPNTILFENQKNIEKYQQLTDRAIPNGVTMVQPKENNPYVLYYVIPETGVSRWIVQPVPSLDRAVFVCKEWNRIGVNTPKEGVSHSPYTQIQWLSDTSYKISIMKGGENCFVALFHTENGTIYQSFLPYAIQ